MSKRKQVIHYQEEVPDFLKNLSGEKRPMFRNSDE